MLIDLRTSGERSSASSLVDDFDILEEVEQLPTSSPLAAVNLYHFPATDGIEIELTTSNQAGAHKARCFVAAVNVLFRRLTPVQRTNRNGEC